MDTPALYKTRLTTQLGDCTLYTMGDALVGLAFAGPYEGRMEAHLGRHTGQTPQQLSDSPLAKQAIHQLEQYLSGHRCGFDLPLHLVGTPFQQKVWQQLLALEYGQTITYGQLAARCGTKSARAVGTAVGSNPLCVVVPCHRVLAADGRVGQYSGGQGPKTKAWLLKLEGAAVKQ